MAKLAKLITSKFASREGILDVRLKTAKIFFVFSALMFSLNYFFIGAGFYDNFLSKTLPYMYILFIASLMFLIHLMCVKKFLIKKPMIVSVLFLVLLIIIFSSIAYSLFI